MKLYSIRDWDELYENSRSRSVKDLDWVPMPNRHDGENYSKIMHHQCGGQIFSAFVLMVQVASRCKPRGVLIRDNGKPHTPLSLSLKTRAPQEWFEVALDFLHSQTDWLDYKEVEGMNDQTVSILSASCHPPVTEGKGREGKGIEEETAITLPPTRAREIDSEKPDELAMQPVSGKSDQNHAMQPNTAIQMPDEAGPCCQHVNASDFKLETFVQLAAALACPTSEAQKFYDHFEASGWIDKNGNRVVNPKAKFRKWVSDLRAKPLEQKHHANGVESGHSQSSEFWRNTKALEQVEASIKVIESRATHTAFDVVIATRDREAYSKLKARRKELKKALELV